MSPLTELTPMMFVVDAMEEMLGSYGPSMEPHERTFAAEEAPKGLLARGHYQVRSKFIDDDKANHLDFEWTLEIIKDKD